MGVNRFGDIEVEEEETLGVNRFGDEEVALSAQLDAIDKADTRRPAPERKPMSALNKAAALAQQLGQGTLPYYDELVSGAYGAGQALTGGSFGEGYDSMNESMRNQRQQYKNDSPNISMMAETTAAFNPLNPINKIGPVSKMGQGWIQGGKDLASNVARNVAEAGIFGMGQGEGGERIENAKNAMIMSGGFTGALDSAGRTVGKIMGDFRLPNRMERTVPDSEYLPPRVGVPEANTPLAKAKAKLGIGQEPRILPEKLETESVPLQLSNPKSTRAGLVRTVLARIPGASEKLDAKQMPFVQEVADTLREGNKVYDEQATNLARHERNVKLDTARDIDADNFSMTAKERVDADALAARQQSELDVLEARQAQARLEEASQADAALMASDEVSSALNIDTLKASVPADRADAVTKGGQEGFNQALDQVNQAYDDAWGTVDKLASGTIDAVVSGARYQASQLDEQGARIMNRLAEDAEKLGAEGQVKALDNAFRKAQKSGDVYLQDAVKELRATLRMGLPDESRVKLDAVDAVYPNLLTSQKASATAAQTKGVPTPAQTLSAANVIAGERRAAGGQQPMAERIYEGIDAAPTPAGKASVLRQTMEADAARQAVERQQAAEQKGLSRSTKDTRAAKAIENRLRKEQDAATKKHREEKLRADRKEAIDPLEQDFREITANAGLGAESPYIPALLAGQVLPGKAHIGKAGLIAGIGQLLASDTALKAIGGQSATQLFIADLLRSGKSELLTRQIAREAGLLSSEEEDY